MLNTGTAKYIMENVVLGTNPHPVTVANLSVRMITNVSTVYPDGTRYPAQVGQLALGASTANQSFTVSGGPEFNASLATNYLQAHGNILSASYGLHISSAHFKLPLSLYLGGYDSSRVIAPISAQPYSANISNNNFLIHLIDVGIDVDHAGVPVSFQARQGFPLESSSTMASLSVAMNPSAPYLYLSGSICQAITKGLPLIYDQNYGLYFWNVSDASYASIITAPAFISFTLRSSASNITVKVPFQLLNLTMEAPMVIKSLPYFPCTIPQNGGPFSLGRAFLQATFIGVNWDQGLGQWFLAQAPGPNAATDPSALTITGTKLTATGPDWAQSWKPYWTPIPVQNVFNTSTSNSNTSKPSTPPPMPPASRGSVPHFGKYLGLSVGIIFATLIVVLLGYLYWRKLHPSKIKKTTFKAGNLKSGATS